MQVQNLLEGVKSRYERKEYVILIEILID